MNECQHCGDYGTERAHVGRPVGKFCDKCWELSGNVGGIEEPKELFDSRDDVEEESDDE